MTSIDVDPDLTTAARSRLQRCGYTPTVITADGAHGYPDRAPYDRIIVTFGVTSIPFAWIDQTRTGGIILAPVLSGLATLTVTGQGTWRSLDTPPRERFGLIITPQHHTIWLDTPDRNHRWPVGRL